MSYTSSSLCQAKNQLIWPLGWRDTSICVKSNFYTNKRQALPKPPPRKCQSGSSGYSSTKAEAPRLSSTSSSLCRAKNQPMWPLGWRDTSFLVSSTEQLVTLPVWILPVFLHPRRWSSFPIPTRGTRKRLLQMKAMVEGENRVHHQLRAQAPQLQ